MIKATPSSPMIMFLCACIFLITKPNIEIMTRRLIIFNNINNNISKPPSIIFITININNLRKS